MMRRIRHRRPPREREVRAQLRSLAVLYGGEPVYESPPPKTSPTNTEPKRRQTDAAMDTD